MASKNQNNKNSGGRRPQIRPMGYGMWIYGLLFLLIIGWSWLGGSESPVKTNWNTVEQMIADGDVESIEVVNKEQANVRLRSEAVEKYAARPEYKNIPRRGTQFVFNIGDVATFRQDLDRAEEQYGQAVLLTYETKHNIWLDVLGFLPFILLMVFFIVMMRNASKNAAGGQGGVFNVGKAKAQVFDANNKDRVTFKDVAGLEEAKVEIMEIVDFLRNPQKYRELGGKIPKGALLVGPPGTGKTLLAKAVAGEANVPFFTMSGSDFVEMFVGVGASRVRDLFRQAKEKAPCIVFIDEIDAVGRARSKNAGFSSNDERENTLNQLLTEMDGFGTNSGVIILAATNRADILDKALMRAGRFDRQIEVGLPDVKERAEIFDVHLRNIKLDPNLDRDFLAKQTPGFSGADIANVCNEAALIAARHDKKFVEREDFLSAIDRIVGGLERRNMIITPEEKRLIAYHEAGHATVSWILENASPLIKVTIIPRGRALGVTMQLPEEDRYSYDRDYLLTRIAILFGGRIAEEVFMNQMTTGASNDFERASQLARDMVMRYGMSDKMGVMVYAENEGEVFLGRSVTKTTHISEKTMQAVDAEIRRILDEQYKRARELIEGHQKEMHRMAKALLDWETIDGDQIDDILAGNEPRPPKSPVTGSAKPEPRKEEKVEEPVQEAKAPADETNAEASASDKDEPK